MRAAAILHPDASDRVLAPFRDPSVELFRIGRLNPWHLPDVALVFGGDGSVHLTLAALVGTGVPLLVVPTGSGNDFAHALGFHAVEDSLRAWRRYLESRSNVRAIDVLRITPALPADGDSNLVRTEYFVCCIAGIGLDAETNELANRLPTWLRAHGGYVISALWALAVHQPHQVTATFIANGEARQIQDSALLVAFGNAPQYGNGMRMLPRAKLDDGLLDVCFVHRISTGKVLRLFHTVFSGGHLAIPEVEYFQTEELKVESEVPMPIYGDGEYLCHTPVDVCVVGRGLLVVTP